MNKLNPRGIYYALLRSFINFQIYYDLYSNRNKFNRGEWLKYNWKANIMIDTVVKGMNNKPRQFEKYIINGEM